MGCRFVGVLDCFLTAYALIFEFLLSASQTSGQDEGIVVVPDPLPKEKCLQALAELRHSKWFAVTAANMPSCVECIRIVKDLSNRDPAWNVLTDWAIELLVERALFTAWMPLNPAASLMRVMEVNYLTFIRRVPAFGDFTDAHHCTVSPKYHILHFFSYL